jgi:endonuclease-3
MEKLNFKKIIKALVAHYGSPTAPPTTDPFEMIIWENVAYLVDDKRRGEIFEELRKTIGLKPLDILNATSDEIDRVTRTSGAGHEQRAARLKEAALVTLNDFGGDLRNALSLPTPKAMKALKQFPSIGDPGAEKILLLTKTLPVLALDSNGLRVLLRLGFGEEKKNYSQSYRSVREAVVGQTGNDCEWLTMAHQILRRHGKTVCKTTKPRCDECPVAKTCKYFVTNA